MVRNNNNSWEVKLALQKIQNQLLVTKSAKYYCNVVEIIMQFFALQNYLESVPQDLSVGHEVMRISATDIDDGNNSLVYYELEAKSQEDEGFFRIDNASGIIILNNSINVSRDTTAGNMIPNF